MQNTRLKLPTVWWARGHEGPRRAWVLEQFFSASSFRGCMKAISHVIPAADGWFSLQTFSHTQRRMCMCVPSVPLGPIKVGGSYILVRCVQHIPLGTHLHQKHRMKIWRKSSFPFSRWRFRTWDVILAPTCKPSGQR